MSQMLIQLLLFAAKTCIIALFIIFILMAFFALLTALAKNKQKSSGRLLIKNLNKKYAEVRTTLSTEILPKKQLKQLLKEQKIIEKKRQQQTHKPRTVFIIHFHGDIKASQVSALTEEITAILNIATPDDEVVLRLESGGGMVHAYGLAAAQLMRLRAQQIPLTVIIDKIAASGGYMMACIANKILCAPFAIIGSIGVIVQLPNFHRLLKEKHIDYEQLMAGEYKRTISLFGENTDTGREKLRQEIEDILQLFKNLINQHRPQIDIQKIATGEHWLGEQAIELKLVDEIKTSDDYLLQRSKEAQLYELCYETKKSLLSKLAANVTAGYGYDTWPPII